MVIIVNDYYYSIHYFTAIKQQTHVNIESDQLLCVLLMCLNVSKA